MTPATLPRPDFNMHRDIPSDDSHHGDLPSDGFQIMLHLGLLLPLRRQAYS